MQGLRIAIPAAALLVIPSSAVRGFLESMPAWLNEGTDDRWWDGRCRWLCNGHQHDGDPRSLAILCDPVL